MSGCMNVWVGECMSVVLRVSLGLGLGLGFVPATAPLVLRRLIII